MKQVNVTFICSFFLTLWVSLLPQECYGWGFYAHQWIHRLAVDALPDELNPLFIKYRNYLSEHAIDPDLWKKNDPGEGVRHYIDIDMYGDYPFDELPRQYDAAVEKFGKETVLKRGIAPWIALERLEKLTEAMRALNRDAILENAIALGHYLGDLYVPLHTVENYDGQLTGNDGIHARFERWMIERFHGQYQISTQNPSYVDAPLDHIFSVILTSSLLVDEILAADSLSYAGELQDDKRFYSDKYYKSLHRHLEPLVTRQIARAATAISSYWLTAWENAGKPDLGKL